MKRVWELDVLKCPRCQGRISAIQLALVPAGEQGREFPKMLYRRGPGQERDETSIVNDDAELHDAPEQGWNRSPSPEPPGYPQNWVEVDFSRGSDYRRVLIRNPKEEQLFREVVDLLNWTRDDKYALAGHGIGWNNLVEEHKQRLKEMIDRDELDIIPDNVGYDPVDSGAGYADARSVTEGSRESES